jgi:hypothetical protein
MIQRIQTLWLALAAVAAFATLKLPLYSGAKQDAAYAELTAISGGIGTLIATLLIGVLASITIFLYTNRAVQIRLCVAGIFAEALLSYLYYRAMQDFTTGTFALSAILHMSIVLFLGLAARAIKQDERLVKDSDRLR